MGKKHKNAATKRRRNSTAVPALGRPVIVEIVHEGAKDDGQRGQLAAHEKRSVCRELVEGSLTLLDRQHPPICFGAYDLYYA